MLFAAETGAFIEEIMLRSNPPPKWLWIGNSNTRPFVTSFDNEFRKFTLCTKIDQYQVEVERAPDNCDNLTISGIDTLVADIGTGRDMNAEDLEAELDKMFAVLESYRMHGMKVVIEPLLPWKRHPEPLRRAAIGAFKSLKTKYPGILIPPKPDSLRFTADGVHLTDRAGAKLFNSMLNHSINFFEKKDDEYHSEAEGDVDLDSSMASTEEIEIIGSGSVASKTQTSKGETSKSYKPPSGKTPNRKVFTSKTKTTPVVIDDEEVDNDEDNTHSYAHPDFKKLEKELLSLRSKMEQRWSIDLLVSAGTKEDLDKIENEKNLNKIVFSGIEIHDLWASDRTWEERLEKMKKAVADFIKNIDPEGVYELGYLRHLNFKLKAARQIIEITMGSEAQAKALRKLYGAKVKTWRENKNFPDEVKGCSLGPSLTLATRVRIAVLQAIAKLIKATEEDTEAWVIQHVARPVLKIEEKKADGFKLITSLGFAQAIAYYLRDMPSAHLSKQDLYDAYSIAGNRFGPEVSHYFVILEHGTARNIAMNRKPRQKKATNQQAVKGKPCQ